MTNKTSGAAIARFCFFINIRSVPDEKKNVGL